MPAAATSDNFTLNRRVVLLTVCLGAFMATLDTSIVNIALPQIAGDFHCSMVQISWVMLIYLLMNVALLLTSGRLGDLLAPGKLFLTGLVVFTGASALCGVSPSFFWMIAARAFQGIGASLMLGVAPKIIALLYAEGERGLALGLFSTAFAAGISVGAPLGGVITTYLGWPFIFYINIPICAVAFGVGRRVLAKLAAQRPWNWRAFDLSGAVVLAGTLGLFYSTSRRTLWEGPSPVDPTDALYFAPRADGYGLAWTFEAKGRILAGPIVHGDGVFIADEKGHLYRLEAND